MKRSDFHYHLPPERIAQEPRQRGKSKMLIVDPPAGTIEHGRFPDIVERLEKGDVLVLNDTRVIPARLIAKPKPGMQRSIELLLTRRLEPHRWECMAKPAKRLRPGDRLEISARLSAEIVEKKEGGLVVAQFTPSADETEFWSALEEAGKMPLPPYIERDHETSDQQDRVSYQTVYADRPGAIAAPTAGLHFTQEILAELLNRGIEIVRITLHVGIGTFRPVQVDDIHQHRMDHEWYEISEAAADAINLAVSQSRRIVAVGTTAVRTLESATDEQGRIEAGEATTDLFITPGYRFRIVGALLTNFHLPESTLIMLVSAFAGRELILRAYEEAIENGYAFYSYGDCMFIERGGRKDER